MAQDPQEARGPMQLHRLHRLKAGPGPVTETDKNKAANELILVNTAWNSRVCVVFINVTA